MISLVLGLGNKGNQYTGTRHNVGFDVLNRVAVELKTEKHCQRDLYESAVVRIGERDIVLAWPTKLMNNSGQATRAVLDDYDLTPEQILVVVDDFNLPLGTLRFRVDGSDGGHNGLASIIECLATKDFPRLRLGIGSPTDKENVTEYVLSPFEFNELEKVGEMVTVASVAIAFAVEHCLEKAMSKYNSNPALPEDA